MLIERIRAQPNENRDVTLSALLQSTSLALIAIALAFFLKGLARTLRPVGDRAEAEKPASQLDRARARALRRADWSGALALLVIALIALAVGRVGSGPLFTEPSGNRAGGIVLIMITGAIVLLVALVVRHFVLSRSLRAPRRLED